MVNRRRFIAGLGSLAVGSGALMQSGAFSTVRGDRGVSVQTATDPNALLGLEGVDDPSEAPAFVNNSTSSMDVTLASSDSSVEFDVGDTGSFADPVTFGIDAGDDREVVIKGNGDSVPVSVTAELPGSSDPKATISLTRDYAVPVRADQADQVQLKENGNTGATGNSGKYEFELENNGSIDVTIVGIGINKTSNTNAAKVSGENTLVVGGSPVLSNSIPIENSTPDQNTRLDPDVSLSTAGPAKTFTFDKFQTENGGKVGMKNESVTVTLFFNDETQRTISI